MLAEYKVVSWDIPLGTRMVSEVPSLHPAGGGMTPRNETLSSINRNLTARKLLPHDHQALECQVRFVLDNMRQLGHQEPSRPSGHYEEWIIGQLLPKMLHELFDRSELAPKQPTPEGVTGVFSKWLRGMPS